MRLKDDYVLRQLGGTWVILPLADATVNFSDILTLNDVGALLWNVLKDTCDKEALVKALLDEYEVSKEQATNDVEEFLEKLIRIGCVENE